MSNNQIENILQSWRLSNIRLNEKASDELIIMTQHKLEFTFPTDFIEFYKKVNGFRDWDIIGNMFSIWPLERIIEGYEKSNNKNFIPFCDYLIDAHRIGFFKDKPGVFREYDEFNRIANSFEETIKLIITDSILLY